MIYVVTSGAYSDYSIDAVFSTREQADAYCLWQNGPEPGNHYGESRVEEYELDVVPTQNTGAYQYIQNMNALVQGRYGSSYWNPDGDPNAQATVAYVEWDKSHRVTGWGPTSEHARRSAHDLCRAIVAGTYVLEPIP